jgi:hypothetical protein
MPRGHDRLAPSAPSRSPPGASQPSPLKRLCRQAAPAGATSDRPRGAGKEPLDASTRTSEIQLPRTTARPLQAGGWVEHSPNQRAKNRAATGLTKLTQETSKLSIRDNAGGRAALDQPPARCRRARRAVCNAWLGVAPAPQPAVSVGGATARDARRGGLRRCARSAAVLTHDCGNRRDALVADRDRGRRTADHGRNIGIDLSAERATEAFAIDRRPH